MRIVIGMVLVLGLACAPALAQKVDLEYESGFDFGSVETFQWVDTPETNAEEAEASDRLVELIKDRLVAAGLTEVQKDGDLWVTYHLAREDKQAFTDSSLIKGTSNYGGAGWAKWGAPEDAKTTATTTAVTFSKGTLVVEAYDPKGRTFVWRGSGTATLKQKPEARFDQAEAVLDKLGKRWRKILAGEPAVDQE